MNSTTVLRIICTDHGTHGPRDLGMVQWTPGELPAVWDSTTGPDELTPEALAQSGRTTTAGKWRTTTRTAVTSTTRADGGITFMFPRCPTCKRGPRSLRDDTLTKIHARHAGPLDLSLVP